MFNIQFGECNLDKSDIKLFDIENSINQFIDQSIEPIATKSPTIGLNY